MFARIQSLAVGLALMLVALAPAALATGGTITGTACVKKDQDDNCFIQVVNDGTRFSFDVSDIGHGFPWQAALSAAKAKKTVMIGIKNGVVTTFQVMNDATGTSKPGGNS